MEQSKSITFIDAKASTIEQGFYSNTFIALVVVLSAFGFIIESAFGFRNGIALFAMGTLIILMSAALIFCEDATPSFVIFSFICMMPLGFYGAHMEDFFHMWWVALFLIPSFIVHMILYPAPRIKADTMFWAIALYAIALLLGGVGFISAHDYFKISSLYYVILLGPGMLCFYIFYQTYVTRDVAANVDYFARAMVGLGITIILIWISQYFVEHMAGRPVGIFFPYRQFKNNLGNYTLLSMPFAFYLAIKRRGFKSAILFLIGLLQYIAIILSACRGGTVAATFVLPFMLVYSFAKSNKSNRMIYAALIFIVLLITGILIAINYQAAYDKILSFIQSGSSGRDILYEEAWRNFLSNPINGVGIGYINPNPYKPQQEMTMYWYHSTILQVIASMGIIGLVAWLFMTIVRLGVLLKKDAFNIFMLLAFLGFEAYSMVNTGDFSPLPFTTMLTFMFVLCAKHNAANDLPPLFKLKNRKGLQSA
ncbi:MAG: O-antigen ligase family protein [Christensenellales bacterium]